MKKIMFNDKYELTSAVLEGRKTMTRRTIKCTSDAFGFRIIRNGVGIWSVQTYDDEGYPIGYIEPRYKVGEMVAIAQSYSTIKDEYLEKNDFAKANTVDKRFCRSNGWNNKMFVQADEMLHHIKITDIKVERLQDISDDDCLREGITRCNFNKKFTCGDWHAYDTSRKAFAALIDKVSGEGTWLSNTWVFVYEFKLID